MAILLIFISTLPGGTSSNSGWAYFVYVISFGQAQDVQTPTIVIYVLLSLTAAIALTAVIVFSILFAKRKKRAKEAMLYNEDLMERRRKSL